jgi:hypothetical protein
MRISALIFALLVSPMAFAGPEHEMPAPKIAPEFEQLKGLVGTWEGKTTMGGKEENVKVTYELTSGGTALVEKLGPGTPHEMVSVYSTRNNKVAMTHYCAIGNQPEMKLKKAGAGTFTFELDGTKGITDKKEMHMHGVVLTLDGNTLKQEWTNYKDNKKGDVAVFTFTKKN